MCAIVGAVLEKPTAQDIEMLRNVFRESQIRGMHATGLSYVRDNQIFTERVCIPAGEFVENFEFEQIINEDGNIYMIGHCRYSTSDLDYNQPLYSERVSIVHNGVITQELPENWEKLYGFRCQTKNDSELLLKTVENGENPLLRWSDASISACELHSDKTFKFYRNGKRPLQVKVMGNSVIVASTKDIFIRAGVENSIDSSMNAVYTLKDSIMNCEHVQTNNKDLQNAL